MPFSIKIRAVEPRYEDSTYIGSNISYALVCEKDEASDMNGIYQGVYPAPHEVFPEGGNEDQAADLIIGIYGLAPDNRTAWTAEHDAVAEG